MAALKGASREKTLVFGILRWMANDVEKFRLVSFGTQGIHGKLAWRISLGIRRAWPLCWLNHRPWERFERRGYPVRTFVGFGGQAWFEIKDGRQDFMVDDGIVSLLDTITSTRPSPSRCASEKAKINAFRGLADFSGPG